jgi:hypothetical protein
MGENTMGMGGKPMSTLETDSSGAQAEARCALDGCDLPLPARSLDEQGRQRAGRQPLYCSKAHADQASRKRRSVDVAAVTDPLVQAHALGQSVLPVARELMGLVADLIGRFDGAETAALARVTAAEAQAAEAEQDASEARQEAQLAEQGRRQALAEVREAVKVRDGALREAATSRREADEVRAEAWEQVAVHERLRGQAEAAREAAEAAVERLAVDLRQATATLERDRAAAAESATRLTAALQEVERATAEAVTWRAQAQAQAQACKASTAQAELDGARVRERESQTAERMQRLVEELSTERAQRNLAEQRWADSREAVVAGERRLSDLQSLLMALGDSPA